MTHTQYWNYRTTLKLIVISDAVSVENFELRDEKPRVVDAGWGKLLQNLGRFSE